MPENLESLVQLDKSQANHAGKMLGRAFLNHPIQVYLIPDESKRKKKVRHAFTFDTKYNIQIGEVYATSLNFEGVAEWYYSDKFTQTFWKMIRCGFLGFLFKIGIKYVRKIIAILNYLDELKERHAPFRHMFLAVIGVDPEFQGKGYASKLMRPMLARLDQENLPCYLETQEEEKVSLYEHFGFEIVVSGSILDTNVPLWCMLREKQTG